MAGIYGNHPEDIIRERECDKYTDSLDDDYELDFDEDPYADIENDDRWIEEYMEGRIDAD